MRRLAFSLIGALAAFPAAASSFEVPKQVGDAESITQISCRQCPALIEHRRQTYVVPDIAPNTDRTEFKDVGGRMKIVRTEAWLGGSPVVFMTTPTEAQLAALHAGSPAVASAATPLSIPSDSESLEAIAVTNAEDRMTTAALDAATVTPKAASFVAQPSHDFDGKAFQLRLQ
jgi:hypothetical protein